MPCATPDVLVVGSGPAGCLAALAAWQRGARVTLAAPRTDRHTGTMRRIETIAISAFTTARQLGVGDAFAQARTGSVEAFLRDGKAARLDATGDGDACHIDRSELDTALRAHVAASAIAVERSGLTHVEPSPETVLCRFDDGKRLSCAILVDATGRSRSPVPGWRERLSPPLLSLTGLARDRRTAAERAVTRFDSKPWGWLWTTNQCGDDFGWTALIGAELPCPTEIAALKAQSREGSILQCSATWQVNVQQHPRILPVGDASGSLDPAAGRGLANVLTTCDLLDQVMLRLGAVPGTYEAAARDFHTLRCALLLGQADQLSRHYSALGILQSDADMIEG